MDWTTLGCDGFGGEYRYQNDLSPTIELRSTQEVPAKYRSVFKDIPYFNILQSSVLDDVLYSDQSLVVCAPTGSGKTMIFELAIIRMLIKSEQHSPLHTSHKVVYMAPIKALCAQRCQEWQEKFATVGLRCIQLTGDSNNDDLDELRQSNIIFTTPEKWDHTTRRWHTNMALISQIKLFLIDEVHLLNDESRGATMEAAISRMKTKRAYLSLKGASSDAQAMRFVGVSATIPNVEDIAQWLSTPECPSTHFTLSGEMRPVKLDIVVIGYPCYSTSEFKFDISLNYKLRTLIESYSSGKPTLVFCSTRKSVEQAASHLASSSNYVASDMHQKLLNQIAGLARSQKLRDCIVNGVSFHHAGLDLRDRQLVEKGFISGHFLVLLSTSTLALGVNLPAHLVIVKSTSHYVGGVCEEYSQSEILQMIGRAGRPQFDTSAVAVIMTKSSYKNRYENVVNGTKRIESSLHRHLTEHLNAEIVLGTIPDTSFILEWIRSTFLYIRATKNPSHYGYQENLSTVEIENLLHTLCMSNLDSLVSENLVLVRNVYEQKALQPTLPGRLMAQYCIAFETMKSFIKLPSASSIKEILLMLAGCKEYQDITLRIGERSTLNSLNKNKNGTSIRFPMDGKIKNSEMKVNCLLQSVLGNIPLQEFALQQDITKIFRTAVRVSRCFMELKLQDSSFQSLHQAVKFCQSIKARMWENSSYVCRQLPGIGPVLASSLAKAGITSFAAAAKKNPRDIELIVNRNPPFGNHCLDAIRHLPKYDVAIKVVKRKQAVIQMEVKVTLLNNYDLKRRHTINGKHSCVLAIGHQNDSVILKQRLTDSSLMNSAWSSFFEVENRSDDVMLSVVYCSQDWVGLDVEYSWSPLTLSKTPLTGSSQNTESCSNAQSAYFDTGKKGNKNHRALKKSQPKNKLKSNVSFSSKHISDWKGNSLDSDEIRPGMNESESHSLSSTNTMLHQLPNLENLDEQKTSSAISMYLNMIKDGEANIIDDWYSSKTPFSSLPGKCPPQTSFARSARKKLQFPNTTHTDSIDIVPDFDLGIDCDVRFEDYLSPQSSNHGNHSADSVMEEHDITTYISHFDDSFDEELDRVIAKEFPSEMPYAKKPSPKNTSFSVCNDQKRLHGCLNESFHIRQSEKLNPERHSSTVNETVGNSSAFMNRTTDDYMHEVASTNFVPSEANTNVANVSFRYPLKESLAENDASHVKAHTGTSFYENRAMKRAITESIFEDVTRSKKFASSLQTEKKSRAENSKCVKKASDIELEKANKLLSGILDFFDL